MIADLYKKVKEWCVENQSDIAIASIIFFTGLSGFGLGRLSVDVTPHTPLSVIEPPKNQTELINTLNSSDKSSAQVVASRNGTTYYYSWCTGVKRIKEENKIWFSTSKKAEQAGLKLAGNCAPR